MGKQVKYVSLGLFVVFLWLLSAPVHAELEVGLGGENPVRVNLYGYFATRYEKVWDEPALEDGITVKEGSPGEWDNPYVNLMGQSQIYDKYRVYFNLSAESAGDVEVKNISGFITRFLTRCLPILVLSRQNSLTAIT